MTIDNSLLDINNIQVVQISWDNILERPILDITTIDNTDIGNIGIGTTNPISKLDVNGIINAIDYKKNGLNLSNIYITSNVFSNESVNFIPRTTFPISKIANTIGLNYDINTLTVIDCNLTVLNTSKWITSNSNIYINNYNVGIGTTNPSYTLDVNGIVNSSDLYINNNSINTKLNNSFTILNNFIENTNTNFINIITSIENLNNNEKKSLIIRQTESNKNIIEFYNSNNSSFIINSNLNVGIGVSNPLYTLDVNGIINCSSINANGYNISFKKDFNFLPILNTNNNNYEYTFDIRNYILNSVGNNIRSFSLYGYSSNGDFTNINKFSGAYIFFLSDFNNGTGKKVVLNETGGTFDYIPLYQIKYSSLTSSELVYITLHQHN